MKHIGCLLLAALILLLPVWAAATSVPANPMAPPGIGILSTPTPEPTATPEPTEVPTQAPTEAPTQEPTEEPAREPTPESTQAPTEVPTPEPTEAPTPEPTEEPTQAPTEAPTEAPTPEPTAVPVSPYSEYDVNDALLDEEIIAQLDDEVRDYLIGGGELIDTVDGIRNILLVGLDARPGEDRSRSDTMIILTLDGNTGDIRMTSLMRDMYVSLPGRSNNRLNAAWVYGGPEMLLGAIEENFGLVIEEYVAVDLRVLIDIVDQLGGLTLTVESKKQLNAINGVIDAFNYQFREKTNDGLLKEVGEQLMNGKQVQAYARYRKIDSDVQRTGRQREVLKKIFDKLQTKSVFELTKIAAGVVDDIETNLTLSDIISLIPIMYNMKEAEVSQLTLPYDVPYQSKTIHGMAVLVADTEVCREKLEAFVNGREENAEPIE